MRNLFFFAAICFWGTAFGQKQPDRTKILHGNQLHTTVYNGGSHWANLNNDSGFQTHFNGDIPKGLGLVTNLWQVGFDAAGNKRFSAERHPTATHFDYSPAVFDHQTFEKVDSSEFNFNKIWNCRRWQVEAHLADWQDNGQIDAPIDDIIGWPGSGNPHFKEINGFELPPNPVGWAGFHDVNSDGVYDAFDGDFPLPNGVSPTALPEQILWFVTSDLSKSASLAMNLPAEIQLTTWVFHCDDNPALENTVFTSHKITLLDTEPLDSVFIGFWQQADLGCTTFSYFGCDPANNDIFQYNPSALGPNETDPRCFQKRRPALGRSLLNQKLHSSWTTFTPPYIDVFNGYFGWSAMNSDAGYSGNDFYTGQCDLAGMDNKKFMFPGDPLDPSSCAMVNLPGYSKKQCENISSIKIGLWQPGQAIEIDQAWVMAHDSVSIDSMEAYIQLKNQMAMVHDNYDNNFENICTAPTLCSANCVWPGDANLDGIANYCDLIDMSLAAVNGSNTGLPRSPREVWWSPWAAFDFSENTPKTTRNKKHDDADGNGKIELQDLKILSENYNETNPNWQPAPDAFPGGPELTIAPLLSSQTLNGLKPGQSRFAKVVLNTPPNLFALGFEIECDPRFIKDISGGNSIGDKWTISNYINSGKRAGTFSQASSKDSVDKAYSNGLLSNLYIRMADEFPETGNNTDTLRLRFKNVKGYLADGTLLALGGQDFVFTAERSSVAAQNPLSVKKQIQFHPNPIGESTFLTFDGLPKNESYRFILTDISGKKLRELPFSGDKVFFRRENLPSGLYFFEIKNGVGAGVFAGKLVLE